MYTFGWHVERKVLLLTYSDGITTNEMGDTVRAAAPFLEQGIPSIHLIIDFRAVLDFQISLQATVQNEALKSYYDDNRVGWTVVIVDKDAHFFHLLASYVALKLEARIQVVETMQQALDFLVGVE